MRVIQFDLWDYLFQKIRIHCIHWQNVRVTQAVESKFLTKITLINKHIKVTVFQLIWKKDSFIPEQCPTPSPWTEPKILIQTHQRGGSMHFQSGILPLVWFSKGEGGSTNIFGFQRGWGDVCYFYPIFTKYSWGSDPLDLPMSQ
jgi:hypothetical protein